MGKVMTRHRWLPREPTVAARHKGICALCGLHRTRAPGTQGTFYQRPDGTPVVNRGLTPVCVPAPRPAEGPA